MFDNDFIVENNAKKFLNESIGSHQQLYCTFLLTNEFNTTWKVIQINHKEPTSNYIPILNSSESFNFLIQKSDDSEYAYKLTTDIYQNGNTYTMAVYIKSDNIGSRSALVIYDGQYLEYVKESNKEFILSTSYCILKDSSIANVAELKYFDYNEDTKLRLKCVNELPKIEEEINKSANWISDKINDIEYMLIAKHLINDDKFNIHIYRDDQYKALCSRISVKMLDVEIDNVYMFNNNTSIKTNLNNMLENIKSNYTSSNELIKYIQEIQEQISI